MCSSDLKQDYVPTNKNELSAWAESFVTTEAKYANKYGIREAGLKTTQTNVQNFQDSLKKELDLVEKKRKQVAITEQYRSVMTVDIRATAQTIKNNFEYTPDVGKEFGIIGPENPFDPKTWKPTLKLRKVTGGVEISFTKSQTDGIDLYRRKQGEDNFTFLSRDTHSPYIDNKDIESPIIMEYYCKGVLHDEEIGLESDMAKITI